MREAYERLGLSITQLERLSGVSRKYIALAFEGANISLSILEKLARALKISSIKLSGLDVEAAEPALNKADLALATTLLERGLRETAEGLAILRNHDVRDDAMSLARQVTSGIRNRKNSGGIRERSAVDDAQQQAVRRRR